MVWKPEAVEPEVTEVSGNSESHTSKVRNAFKT